MGWVEIFSRLMLSFSDSTGTIGQFASAGYGQEQWVEGRQGLDCGHGHFDVAAIGDIGEDAVSGVFDAGGVDVQPVDGPHGDGGQEETVRYLGSCGKNEL
jgi:hypothetical protein